MILCSPVPSYNWTRRGASLPKGAITTSYNRVLIIPKVQVEDQGEYICRVTNDKAAIQNSVVLSIQGRGLMLKMFSCVKKWVCFTAEIESR
jgi:hypothetical protein